MPDASPTRALHIPAKVLAHSELSLLACAVLAEVLDLYRVSCHVFADDDHFAMRCHVKPRTVRDAISELKESGFLIRVVNHRARHKRTLTPTDKWQNTPEVVADSATTSGVVLAESAGSPGRFCRDSRQNLPGLPADSANINTNVNTKTKTTQTHTQKKERVGASQNYSLGLPTEKITAPNSVALVPSPIASEVTSPCTNASAHESQSLAVELAAYWHIREGKDTRRWTEFYTFTRTMAAQDRLPEVRAQFTAYRAYQELLHLRPHGIDKILGSRGIGYINSALLHEGDWVAKLTEAKIQQKPMGFSPPPPPFRAHINPSKPQNVN